MTEMLFRKQLKPKKKNVRIKMDEILLKWDLNKKKDVACDKSIYIVVLAKGILHFNF